MLTLFENGLLYAYGKNNAGVFGARENFRIITDNMFDDLTKINHAPLKGEKIVNFESSENSLILITESGAIFYSGMHAKFMPTPFPCKV